jgi:integrase
MRLMMFTSPADVDLSRGKPLVQTRPSDFDELFDIKDVVPGGFTYVVDGETMEPVEEVLAYLIDSRKLRANNNKTIKTKADHLYEWWLYISELGLEWDEIDKYHIVDYRDRLLVHISPKTRQVLKPSTIRTRITTIVDFYRWAFQTKLVRNEILPKDEALITPPTDATFLAHIRQGASRSDKNEFVPSGHEAGIEYVSPEELNKLFAHLGADPRDKNDLRPNRNWVIALTAASTGMRLFEVLALTKWQIIALGDPPSNAKELMKLRLSVTKNSAPRTVLIPGGVVDRLHAYIGGERDRIVKSALKAGLIRRDPTSLFVNGPFCPDKYLGRPFKEKRAEEAFAAAHIDAGLLKAISIYDETRCEWIKRNIPKHVFHHLRHTYAVTAYHSYSALPDKDRWIKIQVQLGHKSFKTTRDTYFRAVSVSEAQARNMYVDVLKGVIGDDPR